MGDQLPLGVVELMALQEPQILAVVADVTAMADRVELFYEFQTLTLLRLLVECRTPYTPLPATMFMR